MSAPKFGGEPMTKREVLIARSAFVSGARAMFAAPEIEATPAILRASDRVEAAADEVYPLPKVTRLRVLADPDPDFSQRWQVVGGVIEHDGGSSHSKWHVAFDGRAVIRDGCCYPTPERIALWADLLANPTEECDE